MTKISATLMIWAETMFFNACIFMLAEAFTGNAWGMLEAFIFLFLAAIGTLPLLLVIYSLLILSIKLSCYEVPARIAWLTFNLMLLILLVYGLIGLFASSTVFDAHSPMIKPLVYSLISLLCSVLISKSALAKLFTKNNQPH